MTATDSPAGETHEVFNQVPELVDYDPLARDPVLRTALQQADCDWSMPQLRDYSLQCGGPLQLAGHLANQYPPVLQSHDRRGVRINQVEFHPAYHQLMHTAIASGWPTLPWRRQQPGAHCARAAMQYLHHQADSGSGCPLTMTFAAHPVIEQQPALAAEWMPRLLGTDYDGDNKPWYEKKTVTLGMGMTEKQGGSDLRSNTTSAQFTGNTELGPGFEITGHKWFMSAPMCDAFLVLANTEKGLSCFLMPRWRPDGQLNNLHFQRLKGKLGNQSNASSEVEFRRAFAWLLGEEARGIATILQMVALTRFDCMVGSAALMRQALVQALHHSQYRSVSGNLLSQQPLMQSVLTDLAVRSEAALLLSMRCARALDSGAADSSERAFLRLVTAIGKYWICKLAPGFVYEAMECLGGNGYVEDGILPRLYREAPVNSIWEGSGNVQCLDVLRAVQRDPDCLDAVVAELQQARALDARFDRFLTALSDDLGSPLQEELARHLVERLALALQGSLLLRLGNPASAEYFCANFLGEASPLLFGGGKYPGQRDAILSHAWAG